jgi:hypothetical protein
MEVAPSRPALPCSSLTGKRVSGRPVAATSGFYWPFVPSTCPKHRSATVIGGQQRSVAGVTELRHSRMLGSPTVLPKLAVPRGEARPCRARPTNPVPHQGRPELSRRR